MSLHIKFDDLERIGDELCGIRVALERIAKLIDHRPVRISIVFSVPKKGEHEVQITDIQSVTASIAETDAAGNPVQLDPALPAPVWSVADPTILSMTDNGDGSVTFKALGPLGSSQVSVTYGELSAQDQIDVVNSAATALSIKFGTPA